jgi:hypothetical protein
MSEADKYYFKLLKKELAQILKKTNPGISDEIEEWKGNDIVLFQDDLQLKVKSKISEKWFYTHLKADNEKLPRIDMLDLLSKYAGYSGWNDFIRRNKLEQTGVAVKKNKGRKIIWLILLVAVIGCGFSITYKMLVPTAYNFCFIDADLKRPIQNISIEIILLYPGESPVYTKADNSGCFRLKTNRPQVSMVIKSPYYKTDTITRILNKKMTSEDVQLYTNDYALVIHYFSTSNVTDWKKRRRQLDNMIADNALIYQVFDRGLTGMDIYNKQEFINKLTMPVSSLKNIEIIETIYTGQKISMLRFYQKTK